MNVNDDLLYQVALEYPQFVAGCKIEVGLSGGLDSVVLLHLLAQLQKQFNFQLSAVHIHHGLSLNADKWLAFCQRYCQHLNLELRTCHVNVQKNGLGIEAAARALRYQAFSDGMQDISALAHHQNDQIETFMLAVMRGGGLRGMAAMPVLRKLNEHIQIWRPLLNFKREQLEQYAEYHQLAYINDESNFDTRYLRNWLRQNALPTISERVPSFFQHIIANICSLQNDLALLDEVTHQDYESVCVKNRIELIKWRKLSQVRRRSVLWYFAQQNEMGIPTQSSIINIEKVLMQSDTAEWQLPQGKVYAYHGYLFVFKKEELNLFSDLQDKVVRGRLEDILLGNGFILKPHPNGLSKNILTQEVIIRCVNNNDVIKLSYGHKKVKKVLQENHILPLVRKKWPVIINQDDNCIAIANLATGVDYRGEQGVLPVFMGFQKYIMELN